MSNNADLKTYSCATDFGNVLIPTDEAIERLQVAADELCSRGRRFGVFVPRNPVLDQYCEFVNRLSGDVFARGGKLKIAPPLGAWLRHREGLAS